MLIAVDAVIHARIDVADVAIIFAVKSGEAAARLITDWNIDDAAPAILGFSEE